MSRHRARDDDRREPEVDHQRVGPDARMVVLVGQEEDRQLHEIADEEEPRAGPHELVLGQAHAQEIEAHHRSRGVGHGGGECHPTARRLLVGADGIDIEDFLLTDPAQWVAQ